MEQASKSGSGSGSGKAKAKAPPRRNTEARREQNRIASHNYRQKRKQKLALLDKLISEEPGSQSAQPASLDEAQPDVSSGLPAIQQDAEPIEVINRGDLPSSGNRSIETALTNHGWDFLEPYDPFPKHSAAAERALIRAGDHLGSFMATLGESAVIPQKKTVATTTATTLVSQNNAAHTDDREHDMKTLRRVLEGIQGLSQSQKRDLILHLRHQTGDISSPPFFSSASSSSSSSSSSTESIRQETPYCHPAKLALQDMARRYGIFAWRYSSGQISPGQLSQLYTREAGFYAAVMTNFYAIGMKDAEQMTGEDGVSPFSIDQDTGYHASQIAALRPKFRGISPDLQPVDAQLTVGHHPYLDVIPFRIFREKAMHALQCDPPLFDEDELCEDFSKGGLVCWGSQQNSLGMEAGVPWDARSWEPQVWFLRKYWFLVGDWNEEMWKSARWWHNMRGEMINIT